MYGPSEFSEILARVRKEYQLSRYGPEDEAEPQGQKRLITEFFNVALDSVSISLEIRSELPSKVMNTFAFLCV
jgi:hypothetical protein